MSNSAGTHIAAVQFDGTYGNGKIYISTDGYLSFLILSLSLSLFSSLSLSLSLSLHITTEVGAGRRLVPLLIVDGGILRQTTLGNTLLQSYMAVEELFIPRQRVCDHFPIDLNL